MTFFSKSTQDINLISSTQLDNYIKPVLTRAFFYIFFSKSFYGVQRRKKMQKYGQKKSRFTKTSIKFFKSIFSKIPRVITGIITLGSYNNNKNKNISYARLIKRHLRTTILWRPSWIWGGHIGFFSPKFFFSYLDFRGLSSCQK